MEKYIIDQHEMKNDLDTGRPKNSSRCHFRYIERYAI